MAQRSRDRLAHIHQHLQPSSFMSTDTTAGPAAGQLESIECAGIHETRAVLAPSLALKTSFPQATTLPTFPPSVSDYLQLDELLSVEDVELRKRVREMMEKHVAPVMTEYCEKQEFPFQVVPHLASLSLGGSWTKGYGCAGLSKLSNGVALAEIARVDASIAAFVLIHSHLVVNTIAKLGNEEQKLKYLPSLARFDSIGCWAMTEPGYGSDASSMGATATKVEGGWLLNGQKRWPGNCTFADIAVVFARNTTTNKINGFIVKNDTPGYQTAKIKNKIALRIMQNGDIALKDVFVSEEDRIPGVKAFQDINEILSVARIMVMWQALGISMGVYDVCFRYLQERHQFKVPLASFQICQEKLVRMLGNIQAMSLMSWRVTNMYDAGKMSVGQASLGKAWTTLRARETVALGRELMGANGILLDFHVAKAFCDLEAIYTYDGSYEINTLITGREITGISCIKPDPQSTPKPKEQLLSLM